MASVVFESGIRMIRGGMGGFVYRKHADGTVTVVRAPMPDPERVPTAGQMAHREAFKAAVARAQDLKQDARALAAYKALLARRGGMTNLHAMVVGDVMKPPVIKTLDLSGYHGEAGDPILILAEDNFAVARLVVTIRDQSNGQQIEETAKLINASQVGPSVEWRYTATASAPAGHALEVSVTAGDLGGNEVARQEVVTI